MVHSAQYSKFAAKVRKNLHIRKLIQEYFQENAFFLKTVAQFRFFVYLCKQNKVDQSVALTRFIHHIVLIFIACGKTPHINRMSKEKDLDLGPEFDDQECIDFILNLIPAEDRGNMTEDDIQYVLDVIFEYYDQAGLIDEDDTASEGVIDENEEFEFVKKAVKKDGIQLTDQQIQLILDGEFEYGLEKGIYEEDED